MSYHESSTMADQLNLECQSRVTVANSDKEEPGEEELDVLNVNVDTFPNSRQVKIFPS